MMMILGAKLNEIKIEYYHHHGIWFARRHCNKKQRWLNNKKEQLLYRNCSFTNNFSEGRFIFF